MTKREKQIIENCANTLATTIDSNMPPADADKIVQQVAGMLRILIQ